MIARIFNFFTRSTTLSSPFSQPSSSFLPLPPTAPSSVSLPPSTPDPSRQKALSDARSLYQWDHNRIPGVAMLKGLPPSEFPHLAWLQALLQVVQRVAYNSALIRATNLQTLPERISNNIWSIFKATISSLHSSSFSLAELNRQVANLASAIRDTLPNVTVNSLEDHGSLFRAIKPDIIANNNQFLQDDVFGWYRIAGPNPLRINKLDQAIADIFPEFSNEILKRIPMFEGDSIEQLQKDKRIYIVDYPEFHRISPGVFPDGATKDGYYIYSPTALFAVPKAPTTRTALLPLAIRCDQDTDYPMYTPDSQTTDPVTWLAAKLTVQVADAVAHQTIYHLGRAHLLIGIFVAATHRALAEVHPLYKLLLHHFYGTTLINGGKSFAHIRFKI